MKGFMRQRAASWELRVFLGRDPVTGKKRYATKTVRGGKREAQSTLAAMITEAERGSMTRTTATVGELLDTWFEFAAPDFSPKTVKETRGYIDRSLMPALGTRRLSKLKPSDLDAFYRQLLASGGVGGRPLAPGTVRRIHGILRRALNQGVKWGWLGVNPATATTPPRVPVSDIKPPSPEALGRVLRRAESESPDLRCYLMAADASTPWFPDSVSRSFERLCAKEDVPDVRLHDLRHFVATKLLSAGVDVRTVAGRLGHRNASTTLNVYAHFLEQADRGAADVVGDVLNDRGEVDGESDTSPGS